MRIDLNYEVASAATSGKEPPVLGAFPAASDPFLQLAQRWATAGWFPSTPRIALGFVLISGTANRESGYRELAQFIDGVPNTPDATDFSYQVNRPRASRVGLDGLQVNRLSKWSVGGFKLLVIDAGGVQRPLQSPLQHHLRLELDINTGGDFSGLIPRDTVQRVIDDLFAGATEIVERGNRF
jgi:hypothetical protein